MGELTGFREEVGLIERSLTRFCSWAWCLLVGLPDLDVVGCHWVCFVWVSQGAPAVAVDERWALPRVVRQFPTLAPVALQLLRQPATAAAVVSSVAAAAAGVCASALHQHGMSGYSSTPSRHVPGANGGDGEWGWSVGVLTCFRAHLFLHVPSHSLNFTD